MCQDGVKSAVHHCLQGQGCCDACKAGDHKMGVIDLLSSFGKQPTMRRGLASFYLKVAMRIANNQKIQ